MRPQYAQALSIIALTVASGTPLADVPERIYLEEDGIVLFEVEDAAAVDGWELKTDIDGFEGTGYFEWAGPNRFNHASAGAGTTTYHFRIPAAGNYQIRWRSYIAVGDNNTEHNDSWVRLPTGQNIPDEHPLDGWTKIYMNSLGNWSWTSVTVDHERLPVRQFLSEGDHTIQISGRSAGHAIDRILLYRYEDVNYNSRVVDTWNVSTAIAPDGTIFESTGLEENTTPVENTGLEENTGPEENIGPEESESVSLVNVALAPDTWQELQNYQCVGNTLALPSSDAVTFNPTNISNEYTTNTYAALTRDSSSLLLKFDTSLVPPADSAVLEYSTGTNVSDGELLYALGSHSVWRSGEPNVGDYTVPPQFLLELARASGGWAPYSRYHSSIQASAFTGSVATLIVSSQSDTDPLEIFVESISELAPRLLLTGGDDFCANWQANVDAGNQPIQVVYEADEQTETNETTLSNEVDDLDEVEENEVEAEVEVDVDVDVDVEESQSTRRSGGSAAWWMLLGLIVPLLTRIRYRSANTPAQLKQ